MSTLPRMFRLQQTFTSPRLDDIPGEVKKQLGKLSFAEKIKPGQTVAITAGSRGIANIATIVKAAVEHVKSVKGVPFIVPAMGSHGGGTVEGQCKILADYGITPETMGCEIRATMETVIVDTTPQGIPVHFDQHASQADHVLVCGRVKPHTGFVGEVESGLHKMMLIGLGKHEGAKIYHRAIANYTFMEIVTAVAAKVIAKCRVIGGLAIVENASDETALVEAVPPDKFLERESQLLKKAIEWLPRLPFKECDLLIVDRIGKNISGTGMDTNVVGRKYNDHAATEKDTVRCMRILVRGLTEETHGNACGIGLSEFTTEKAVAMVNHKITAINCITGNHPMGGMIPLTFPNDRESIIAALQTIGLTEPPQARIMQISDTLHLGELIVSEAFLPQLAGRADLKSLEAPREMKFDAAGQLIDV